MCDLIKCITFNLLCFNIIYVCCAQNLKKEAYLSAPKLISSAGYPIERHRVTTEDGYILQMHRIPAGRRVARRSDNPSTKGKKAVIVMHGLLGSSGDFVIMGPERSLAYLLADAGYDVWLGNLRGNWYTTHKILNRDQPGFWQYSFHEHGKYDLPAMIDKVLNVTGVRKIMYIGYSMGTTSFFTMMSQKPEYNNKIMAFLGLAPAVYLDNVKPLATLLLKTVNVPKTMQEEGVLSLTMTPRFRDMLLNNICNFNDPLKDICSALIYFLVGEDHEQYDPEMQPIIISRVQPASWRQIEHFGKIAITGKFTSWEDGLWGAVKPYNLSNVRVPVSLLYGENDRLVEKSQIMRLGEDLNKTGMLKLLRPGSSWPKFNHLDFVFAKNVGELLNKPIINYVNKLYNKYYLN